MKKVMYSLMMLVLSSIMFSCSKEEEWVPQSIDECDVVISQTEFEQKVCGKCWVGSNVLKTYTDNNPNAIPFFEDGLQNYMNICFYFEKEKLTFYIERSKSDPIKTFRENTIKFNAANGCVQLEDGSTVMKIYFVDDNTMKVIEGTKIDEGIHYYVSRIYRKMSDSDFEDRRKYSLPHASYYNYFDMNDEMPKYCNAALLADDGSHMHYISREEFESQLVGAKWRSDSYDRNGKYIGEYYEILSDGILRTKNYPYGYEYGTRIDAIAFPTSSTVTITETKFGSKTGTTTHTYAFRYESDSEHPGINDVIYMDSNNVEHRIRIVNHATDYGSEVCSVFRAIIENDGHYCYACFSRHNITE